MEANPAPPKKNPWVRLGVGLVVLILVAGLLGYLFRVPLTQVSAYCVDRFGLVGLFVGVVFTDSWILPPLTHEPLLFFGHAGGLSYAQIFLVAGAASHFSGLVGYSAGALLGRRPAVLQRLEKSGVAPLMARRGAVAVALAAITPIPFAASTWTAGAVGMRLGPFVLACAVRWLKVAVYLTLIVAGWSGAGLVAA